MEGEKPQVNANNRRSPKYILEYETKGQEHCIYICIMFNERASHALS